MKPYLLAILFIGLVVGILAGLKAMQIGALLQPPPPPPPTVVTSATATVMEWPQGFRAIGSVAAFQGVMVSSEVSGRVESIHFESGAEAREGDLLVQLNIETETAQLRAAEAQLELAKRDLERGQRMMEQRSMSAADFDAVDAKFKKAKADLDAVEAAIAKKTIRAPFNGQLGIRQVNIGQVIEPGAPIVSLQALDSVYVDFSLPQQRLGVLKVGLEARLKVDAFPEQEFVGSLTAINPDVNNSSRAVALRATFENPGRKLRPGMFAEVQVLLNETTKVIAIPATAILYSPFGNTVFVIEKVGPPADRPEANKRDEINQNVDTPKAGSAAKQDSPSAGPELVLKQINIRVGETRGDFVAVKGLKEGQVVVSTGVFKLTDGIAVRIDNTLALDAQLEPAPGDS